VASKHRIRGVVVAAVPLFWSYSFWSASPIVNSVTGTAMKLSGAMHDVTRTQLQGAQ